MLEKGSRINTSEESGNSMLIDGKLYVKKGTHKMSRVADGDGVKAENLTNTAGTYRYTVFTLQEGTKVTEYLGNNGRFTEAAPTASLKLVMKPNTYSSGTAPKEEQTEFVYVLTLRNGADAEGSELEGEYSYEVTGTAGEIFSGTIRSGASFTLKTG